MKRTYPVVNINASSVNTLNFIKQALLDIKAQINSNTIIVEGYNIPHS
jgi:hypothetical protein